jgi:hypothetical protein
LQHRKSHWEDKLRNLSDGPPNPLYQVQTDATSGNAPGSAAMIVLNPPAGAASVVVRFVLPGNDLDKNVKKTAERIATQIEQQIQRPAPTAVTSLSGD